MEHLLFSGKQKLAELIHANYRLLLVLSRFNIGLGFGDKTVDEVCRRCGIAPDLFLMVCNVFTFDAYAPGENAVRSIDIDGLIAYLSRSHQDYRELRVPTIKEQLHRLAECYHSRDARLVTSFFDGYATEIEKHLEYEESIVFPYTRELRHGTKTSALYNIKQFEKNHGNIEEKLHDLKNIIIKYLPDQGEEELRDNILFNLFWLEEDLNKHTRLEERILIPLVQRLEDEFNQRA
jgi:regulator of cell morphogenesis and NO signaling